MMKSTRLVASCLVLGIVLTGATVVLAETAPPPAADDPRCNPAPKPPRPRPVRRAAPKRLPPPPPAAKAVEPSKPQEVKVVVELKDGRTGGPPVVVNPAPAAPPVVVQPAPAPQPVVVYEQPTQPDPDRDHDGLANGIDKCPDEPGLPVNDGCPASAKPPVADIKPALATTAPPASTQKLVEGESGPIFGILRPYGGASLLYSSLLPRGGAIGAFGGVAFNRINASRHGAAVDLSLHWHPEVIGQGNVWSLKNLTFTFGPSYLFNVGRNVVLKAGVDLLYTAIVGEGTYRERVGIAKLGFAYVPHNGGAYVELDAGIGGGDAAFQGYEPTRRFAFMSHLRIGAIGKKSIRK